MDYKNISKTVIKGWIAIVSTIALYCIYQYYLNNITLSAFIKHVSAVIIPFVIGLWAYNCKNIYDKWIYSAGFIVTYGIFSFSGSTFLGICVSLVLCSYLYFIHPLPLFKFFIFSKLTHA